MVHRGAGTRPRVTVLTIGLNCCGCACMRVDRSLPFLLPQVMNDVFKLGGEAVPLSLGTNTMRIIAEGAGEDDQAVRPECLPYEFLNLCHSVA